MRMLSKIYIAVPLTAFLSYVGFATASVIQDNESTKLLGNMVGVVCDLSQTNCETFREKQPLPFKITPPLGLSTALNKQEVYCLAKNISEEAVQNYLVDKIHVGWGTINRVKLNYARTICGVITQSKVNEKGHRIHQMEWRKDPVKVNRPPRPENVQLAIKLLKGEIPNPSPDCMITNWYNVEMDSKSSFNAIYRDKKGVCSKRPKWTPHFYMEAPVS